MMYADDHSQPSRVMYLSLGQMHEQVADSPVQDVVKGQPDLIHAPHLQATRKRDLLTY
jgi:hypothetical protein